MESSISTRIRQEFLDRKYKNKVWFIKKPTDHTTLFDACWCPSCMHGYYSKNLLKIYSYKGIKIKDGEIITPLLADQVSNVFYTHFHNPPEIPALQDLSGQIVTRLIKDNKIDRNTLPNLMKRNVHYQVYTLNTAEYRRYIHFKFITLPKLFTSHIGQYIVIGNTHPNKFKEEARIQGIKK